MDVLEAIRKRRSIRRFKKTPLSEGVIETLMEAARLAPSGSNIQPWRFVIVKDERLKARLCRAAFSQKFLREAPVVMVCCGDLLSWKAAKGRSEELISRGDIHLNRESEEALMKRAEGASSAEMHERVPTSMLNVAIAVEHIVLEAVELGLGSCWVRLFDEEKVKQALGLPNNLCVVALLPLGIPDEEPEAGPRLPIHTISSIL
ncbi:nitroreductase family protein [Candidatus Bathyarchaeota archaeon]|nr:nitroreductase family protein [Candidatus Bathyarchaeota archaeon]